MAIKTTASPAITSATLNCPCLLTDESGEIIFCTAWGLGVVIKTSDYGRLGTIINDLSMSECIPFMGEVVLSNIFTASLEEVHSY